MPERVLSVTPTSTRPGAGIFENYEKNSPSMIPKIEESSRQRGFCCCSRKLVGFLLIGFGVFFILLGSLYGGVLPSIVNSMIDDQVVTCDADSGSKDKYLDPYGDCDDCVPYYVSLNMFNATNAEEYLAGGVKLKVQEMGPYVYRRREIKLNVTFDDNYRVSYKKYTYHTFQEALSCEGCKDTDEIVSLDVGYMNVISTAGGETAFLASLAMATFASTANTTEVLATIAEHGEQMMRWVNGLNSMDPEAMMTVSNNSAVIKFLAMGPTTIEGLDLTGFAYNGLFVKRTVSQWALGYPSILAGMALGANYLNVCKAGMNDKCDSCEGTACLSISAECAKCTQGAAVMAVNELTCGIYQAAYASVYGEDEATSFVTTTCGMCSSVGLCAAPLPGIVEQSGMDYSTTPPDSSTLSTYTQRTGCDDLNYIGWYEEYDGYDAVATWVDLGERRNPTLSEIASFATYGNCVEKPDNVTCVPVAGSDGSNVKPGGTTINGFVDSVTVDTVKLYLGAAKMDVTVFDGDTTVDYEGVTLNRFFLNTSLILYSADGDRGAGFPVDGLAPISFTAGFLAYISAPFFIYGDSSLTENVVMTNTDGSVVTNDIFLEDGVLKQEYVEKYMTYIDIEAGTGSSFSARKRSQANYALGGSIFNTSIAMTDVVWQNLIPEVVLPVYWVQEAAEATESLVDQFDSITAILSSFVPVLVVLVVLGFFVIVGGVWYRRRTSQIARAHSAI